MRKDRTLTETALTNFLTQLDAHPERAAQRYVQLHRKLTCWFSQRQCAAAEDLAQETLDLVAARLLEGVKIVAADLTAYCIGVAKYVLLAHRRRLQSFQTPLDEMPRQFEARRAQAVEQASVEQEDDEQRAACVRQCLQSLSPPDRQLIASYYHDDWNAQARQRKQLAAQLGLTEVGLRTRAHRLRATLKTCAQRCLQRRDS